MSDTQFRYASSTKSRIDRNRSFPSTFERRNRMYISYTIVDIYDESALVKEGLMMLERYS